MYVNHVNLANGEEILDLRGSTVAEENLFEGEKALNAEGRPIVGTFPNGEIDIQSALIEQISNALNGKAGGSEDLNAVLAEQEELIDTLKTILKSKASGGGDGSDKFDASLDGSLTEVNSTVTTTMPHCCRGLTNIKTVNLPNATTIATYAFNGCTGITEVYLGKATAINSSAFTDCGSLTKLDCGESPNFGGSALANCTALTTLIIRGTKVPSLSTSTFSGVGNNFDIYVKSNLIESFKTATNWSTYADRFRAIEDYPDICGG